MSEWPSPWAKDVKPAPRANDAEFFRRVHLDLAGRIPSVTEARDFLDDDRPDKRRLWVDRILRADPDDPSYKEAYVNHFTNVWRAWLLAQTNQAGAVSAAGSGGLAAAAAQGERGLRPAGARVADPAAGRQPGGRPEKWLGSRLLPGQ